MESKLVVLNVPETNHKVSFIESDELKEKLYATIISNLVDKPHLKNSEFVTAILDVFQFKKVDLEKNLEKVLENKNE